jgi:hypothetical protein
MYKVNDKVILSQEEYDMLKDAGMLYGWAADKWRIASPGEIIPLSLEDFEAMLEKIQILQPPNEALQKAASLHKELVDESVLDVQIGGDHYKRFGDMQPWQVFARWFSKDELRGYAKGTVIAYLARDKENMREDMEKAMHTLQLYLEVSKKEGKE